MIKEKKKPQLKSKTFSKPEMWRIEWEDHASMSSGWVPIDEIQPRSITVISTGFKVAENETRIVLAASMGYSNTAHNAADFTSIIKSCIVKQRKLK